MTSMQGPLPVPGGNVSAPTGTLTVLVTAAATLMWQADASIQPKMKTTLPLRLPLGSITDRVRHPIPDPDCDLVINYESLK